MIGLPLGGLLVYPARNFPPFHTDFWKKYPFALPCFVTGGFAIFSVAFGLYLSERGTV